jgi:hypothetical protein
MDAPFSHLRENGACGGCTCGCASVLVACGGFHSSIFASKRSLDMIRFDRDESNGNAFFILLHIEQIM